MKPLPNKYNSQETEKKWQADWEDKGVYHWDENATRDESYVIDTPPPTVSGVLHMGHIFSYTQADFVARYQRMKGKSVFYPMGFDDNGLPTERLVEKVKKIRATDLSREDFIAQCESVAEGARAEFRRLFESIALSVDWNQEYHTISEESRKISQLSFLDLFHKDHAYRKLQPMLWDPVDQTALAQAEVEDKELKSTFNDIIFMVSGDGCQLSEEKDAETRNPKPETQIIIGTTRPELIPACVAIFYHPDDKRYTHLKGKHAITPLFGVKVPIMEDDTVEMDKGTGIMMCCTFGDEADIDKWRKHDLPARMVLDNYAKMRIKDKDWLAESDATLIEEIDGKRTHHQDKNVPNARGIILQKLEEAGQLVKSEEITHAVPCAERSGAPLEIMPTQQWFVKILDKKEELKKKAEECNWYPEYMKIRIDQWIDGLSWDWCISRQRYFGVPFPVWYSKRAGEEGKIILATPDQLPINPLVDLPAGYTRDEVEAEADVMDTWATSSVSPQLSSHGITQNPSLRGAEGDAAIQKDVVQKNENGSPRSARDDENPYILNPSRHEKLFPADLRPQAHEIIRTWAFYTIVKAYLHEDQIPWKNLMISGWCLASDKSKMSKSKGNVVTPVGLIEEKSADAVRFWASTSKLGTDTAFSEDVLKIGKKLVNKLWNATKFAAVHLDKLDSAPTSAKDDIENGRITETLDKWILSRLHKTIAKADEEFAKYEYSNSRAAVEDFFWNDFCDNYLEMVKARAYGEKEHITHEQQMSAVHTLYHCLDGFLRLFAPFVPHITEELHSHIFDDKFTANGSIHSRGSWPDEGLYPADDISEASGIASVEILNSIRKLKAEKNVSLKWPLTEVRIACEKQDDWKLIEPCINDLKEVSNARAIISADQPTTEQFAIEADFAEESDAA